MSHVTEINEGNFQAEVLESPVTVLLDVDGTHCPPCHKMAPVIEELAATLNGSVKVAKMNVEENGDIAAKYSISAVPTFLVFRAGQVASRTLGIQPRQKLLGMVSQS